MELKVFKKIMLNNVIGAIIATPMAIYYVATYPYLNPAQLRHFLFFALLIVVPGELIANFIIFRRIIKPIDMFLNLGEEEELDEDWTINIQIRALNLPLTLSLTILITVGIGILGGITYMIAVARITIGASLSILFGCSLMLILLILYSLLTDERILEPILLEISSRRKTKRELPSERIIRFDIQVRLLSVFLAVVFLPLVNLGLLSYHRVDISLRKTVGDELSSLSAQLGRELESLEAHNIGEEELSEALKGRFEDFKNEVFIFNSQEERVYASSPELTLLLTKELYGKGLTPYEKPMKLDDNSFILKTGSKEYIVGIAPSPQNRWTVIQARPLLSLQQEINSLGSQITTIVVISLIAIFFIAIFFARSVTLPISQVVSILKDIAQGEGDLTRHLNIQTNNEISLLSTWFNKFVDSILRIVSQVRDASLNVTSSVQELSLVAEDINAGTEEISAATEEVTSGAEVQNKRVMETSRTLEEMGELMAEVRRQAERLGEASRRADEVAKAGGEAVGEMVAKMDRIREVTDRSSSVVGRLGERSQQIGKIVSIITELAEQISMLALSASIEAAKAQEYGEGFVVVAREMRELADSSGSSALQIRKIVSHIQEETEEVISSMKRGVVEVEEGREVVAKTGEALQQIVDMVREMATMIEQIRASVQGQVQSAQRVVKAIDEVSVIAEENASSASQVSATIEEQVRLTERMVAFSEGMEQMSDNLRKLVSTFKLNRLGVAFQSFSNPFFLSMKDSIEDTAPKLGVEVTISNAEYDLSQQLRAVERFVFERVDAILLNPVDSWRIAPAIRAANKIGIPVITMDVNALGEEIEIASFIASDNFQAGELCADYIVSKLMDRGKIAILGWAEMESCIKRQDGFKAYLGRYPQIEVVAEIDTQGDMNLIEKAMTEILRKTPDLEAVFGVNDPIALRAWKVVKEAEREREVFTVGVDANPESIEAIRSQQGYDLTIAQFPRAIGRRAIETVFDIVAGREVEKEQLLKVMPITINNLDSYQGWDAEMPLRIEKPW